MSTPNHAFLHVIKTLFVIFIGRVFLILFFLFGLIACRSVDRNPFDLVNYIRDSKADHGMTLQEIQTTPWERIYAQLNGKGRSVLVLAFRENNHDKWIAADRALINLDNRSGRVISTLGFDNDLLYVSNTQQDPLLSPNTLSNTNEWHRITDWKPHNQSGYALQSTFSECPAETLTFFDFAFATRCVHEQTTMIQTNKRFDQYFWYDLRSGQLIRSIQRLSPSWPELEITHITVIARLIQTRTQLADQTAAQKN